RRICFVARCGRGGDLAFPTSGRCGGPHVHVVVAVAVRIPRYTYPAIRSRGNRGIPLIPSRVRYDGRGRECVSLLRCRENGCFAVSPSLPCHPYLSTRIRCGGRIDIGTGRMGQLDCFARPSTFNHARPDIEVALLIRRPEHPGAPGTVDRNTGPVQVTPG